LYHQRLDELQSKKKREPSGRRRDVDPYQFADLARQDGVLAVTGKHRGREQHGTQAEREKRDQKRVDPLEKATEIDVTHRRKTNKPARREKTEPFTALARRRDAQRGGSQFTAFESIQRALSALRKTPRVVNQATQTH
jgi:hypothetical protein